VSEDLKTIYSDLQHWKNHLIFLNNLLWSSYCYFCKKYHFKWWMCLYDTHIYIRINIHKRMEICSSY